MFARLGSWCFRRRRLVLASWILGLIVVGGVSQQVGGTFGQDFALPGSDSTTGVDILKSSFGGLGAGSQGTVVFRAEQGVDDPEVEEAMTAYFTMLTTLAEDPDVDVATDPAFDSLDDETRADLAKDEARRNLAGATVTSPYAPGSEHQIASEGDEAGLIAFGNIDFADDDFEEAATVAPTLRDLAPEIDGLRVELGGQVFAEFAEPDSESLGLAFAVVILVVAFGSVIAMGLPIGVALAGIAGGSILVTFVSNLVTMPDFSPFLGGMIGLGVGIDYALFIVTRYRENLHHGHTPEEATSTALDTAGRAVTFAGVTVVISFLGMVVMGVSFISGLAISAAVVVFMTVVASLTLLPALLGFAGQRVEVTRWRGIIATGFVALGLLGMGLKIAPMGPICFLLAGIVLVVGLVFKPLKREVPARKQKPLKQTSAYRWSRVIQHHPWPAAIGASAFLLILSLPVLGLWLGWSDEGNYPEDTTTRQAYDLLVDGFGPGFNGPFILVTEVDGEKTPEQLAAINEAVQADPNVAFVSPAIANNAIDPEADLTAYLWQVTPNSTPQSEETTEFVHRLRADVLPPAEATLGSDVNVTGQVPGMNDFSDYLTSRMPYFFIAVLVLSFLLLMAVFRSLLVPLKAVIMNLLSIGASYGIMVMLLNWGWGSDVTHLEPGPIETFAPMMLFAIVFGLSMDYEVFLLSRIKEEWHRTGDSHTSVANGLAATARVITAAAAIMVVVFGAFLLEADRTFKMFGIGLATAIFLDATVVRMVLVPATMELLGDRNWWLPKWLDRIIPNIDVEGTPDEISDFDDGDPDDEPDAELVNA